MQEFIPPYPLVHSDIVATMEGLDNHQKLTFDAIISGRNVFVDMLSERRPLLISTTISRVINPDSTDVQALILSPTVVRVNEIHQSITSFCKEMNINASICIGQRGPTGKRSRHPKKVRIWGSQVISGTPSSVVGKIDSSKFHGLKVLFLDESGEKLSSDFRHDVCELIDGLKEPVQIVFLCDHFTDTVCEMKDNIFNKPPTSETETNQDSSSRKRKKMRGRG